MRRSDRVKMCSYSVIFVGMYPNPVDKYLNSFFQNLIFGMADNGVKCTVISPVSITKYRARTNHIPNESVDITPEGNNVRVIYPRYFSASGKKIGEYNTRHIGEYFFQQAAVKAAKTLKEHFDFAYGHFVLDGGLAAIKVGKALGIPSFFAYGECDYKSQVEDYYGEIPCEKVEGLKGIISVSSKNTNELSHVNAFRDIHKITIPNAANSNLFYKKDKTEMRRKYNLPDNEFIVGFVGGFIDRKGDKRLLEAVNRIDGAYVAYAGRGDNPPKGEKVLFCDSLEHEEIPDFLNAMDVFVLPTLNEGSCNAIVEAMACGLPIISSDLPFNDDILSDDNSIRINPNSIDDIEKAIRTIYEDTMLRERLSEGALRTAGDLEIHTRADRILQFMINESTII